MNSSRSWAKWGRRCDDDDLLIPIISNQKAQVSSSDADALSRMIDKNNNGIDYLEWVETLDPTSSDRCVAAFCNRFSLHFAVHRADAALSQALFLLGKLLSKDQQLPSLSAQEMQEMKNLYAAPVSPRHKIVTLVAHVPPPARAGSVC